MKLPASIQKLPPVDRARIIFKIIPIDEMFDKAEKEYNEKNSNVTKPRR